ncbi:hypothetical protein QAD02_012791 [Eretmocerus hayati]|uniref:Uncharacterized protein n=1 Tax=Eretmocerus hayati TaxID=131215 RepID=A0ACC2P0E2_9HYME|nr:hypothetical protein QAD02_012791 [Eretmocerus hayati]
MWRKLALDFLPNTIIGIIELASKGLMKSQNVYKKAREDFLFECGVYGQSLVTLQNFSSDNKIPYCGANISPGQLRESASETDKVQPVRELSAVVVLSYSSKPVANHEQGSSNNAEIDQPLNLHTSIQDYLQSLIEMPSGSNTSSTTPVSQPASRHLSFTSHLSSRYESTHNADPDPVYKFHATNNVTGKDAAPTMIGSVSQVL